MKTYIFIALAIMGVGLLIFGMFYPKGPQTENLVAVKGTVLEVSPPDGAGGGGGPSVLVKLTDGTEARIYLSPISKYKDLVKPGFVIPLWKDDSDHSIEPIE